jgi:hypothetical protein
MSDYKGYRVVVLTPLRNGGTHRTPWSRWMPREDAVRVWDKWRRDEPGRILAVESKRGALSQVTARYGWKVSA